MNVADSSTGRGEEKSLENRKFSAHESCTGAGEKSDGEAFFARLNAMRYTHNLRRREDFSAVARPTKAIARPPKSSQ